MRQHSTRALAFEDMVAIVRRSGYWTQTDDPPPIPVGTSVIGMGSYGGRGLYLHGVVAGGWASTSGPTFRHKLPVTWAHTVYEVPGEPEEIGALVELWVSCTRCRSPAGRFGFLSSGFAR